MTDFEDWIRELRLSYAMRKTAFYDLANLAAHQHEANVAAEALVTHERECDKCWNSGMADCPERQELRGAASNTRVFALSEAEQFREKYSEY